MKLYGVYVKNNGVKRLESIWTKKEDALIEASSWKNCEYSVVDELNTDTYALHKHEDFRKIVTFEGEDVHEKTEG